MSGFHFEVHDLSIILNERDKMKSILLTMMAGLLLVGCSASSPGVKEGSSLSEQPDWVVSRGRYEKGIGAVGVAPKSGLGTQMQMDEADLAARTQLTQILDTKVQGSISTTASRVKEMGLGTGEELGTLQTESVRRSLINKRLKGSYPIKQWKDPENGELFVWLVMDQKDINSMANEMANSLIKKKLNESHEDHQKRLKIMQEELKNEFDN